MSVSPNGAEGKRAAPLLEVRGLTKHYPLKRGIGARLRGEPALAVRAVDGIDFAIDRGQTLGLVGESGCGKTTTGRCVLFLQTPTAGEVLVDGERVDPEDDAALRRRRRELQIVFQDPNSSLNPRMTIGQTLGEALTFHRMVDRGDRGAAVAQLLETVGLSQTQANRYPNELSGGQRQRVGIARALAVDPALIVADEPVSALDVSVQAQILQLLGRLREERGLSYLFISHDLGVVRHIADAVAVMYLGLIVERAPSTRLFANPLHPYTQGLLAAAPVADPRRRRARRLLEGDPPSPIAPPSGCRFRTRCPYATDLCAAEVPPLREIEPGHFVACHYAGEVGVSHAPSPA
ncbi:MAG TPA: oligopeptide/dipeptide ABC transporter ATP-binding protein [Thermomicrobiales bacterium]|nr:oligopeptide/dipeptide ABC transporter ATP-binding protein [Thermomicrobiales bacterium]